MITGIGSKLLDFRRKLLDPLVQSGDLLCLLIVRLQEIVVESLEILQLALHHLEMSLLPLAKGALGCSILRTTFLKVQKTQLAGVTICTIRGWR